jgi:hypothetical protein
MGRDVFAEWEASDDPVKRAHVANVRAIKAGLTPPPSPVDPAAERAAILRRRAGKMRLNLGEKAPGRR